MRKLLRLRPIVGLLLLVASAVVFASWATQIEIWQMRELTQLSQETTVYTKTLVWLHPHTHPSVIFIRGWTDSHGPYEVTFGNNQGKRWFLDHVDTRS